MIPIDANVNVTEKRHFYVCMYVPENYNTYVQCIVHKNAFI